MTVQLLETAVYEGKEIVAVTNPNCDGCISNAGIRKTCHKLPYCGTTERPDKKSVIWMYLDDALKARLRGYL